MLLFVTTVQWSRLRLTEFNGKPEGDIALVDKTPTALRLVVKLLMFIERYYEQLTEGVHVSLDGKKPLSVLGAKRPSSTASAYR